MKKVIILESDDFIRNYLETKAFDLILDDEYEIIAINIGKEYRSKQYNINNKITFIECKYAPLTKYINDLNFNIGIVKKINKSASFRYRYHITISQAIDFRYSFLSSRICSSMSYKKLKNKLSKNIDKSYINFFLINFFRLSRLYKFFKKIPHRFVLSFFSLPYIYDFFQKIRKLINPCPVLHKALNSINPGLVIYPSNAYSAVGEDILKLSKKGSAFKTLFLIDNWDNMSSKSVFVDKPDYLGVWGEQSRKHAIDIQGINPNNIYILGTPRYLIYERLGDDNNLERIYDFPYILFLGMGGLGYDEIGALKRVSKVLSDNRSLFPKNCKIIYRPHPFGRGMTLQSDFNNLCDENIVLDKQLFEHFNSEIYFKNRSFQLSFDYFPSILLNSTIVVGGATTMIMEALFLGKNSVVLSYDDGNEVNLKKQFKALEHFKGLDKINSLFVVNDEEDMRTAMLSALCVEWSDEDKEEISSKLDYYINISLLTKKQIYTERLKKCIDEIIK